MYVINDFSKLSKFAFLSNSFASTIYIDGKSYKTVEHAIQAYKTTDENSREIIRKAKSVYEAKRLGMCILLRSDWEEVKVQLMKRFLIMKFENPMLGCLLTDTGEAVLVYENKRNDTFWGICNGEGENFLGRLLAEVREEIQDSDMNDIFGV